MADPVTAITVVSLAMKFLEGIAGESAKKLTGELWDAIKNRFVGCKKVEDTIVTIEQSRDPKAIEMLTVIMDGEMLQDDIFAGEMQKFVQQINNLTQIEIRQTNFSQGRDQFVINNPTGDLKLGGS